MSNRQEQIPTTTVPVATTTTIADTFSHDATNSLYAQAVKSSVVQKPEPDSESEPDSLPESEPELEPPATAPEPEA